MRYSFPFSAGFFLSCGLFVKRKDEIEFHFEGNRKRDTFHKALLFIHMFQRRLCACVAKKYYICLHSNISRLSKTDAYLPLAVPIVSSFHFRISSTGYLHFISVFSTKRRFSSIPFAFFKYANSLCIDAESTTEGRHHHEYIFCRRRMR